MPSDVERYAMTVKYWKACLYTHIEQKPPMDVH